MKAGIKKRSSNLKETTRRGWEALRLVFLRGWWDPFVAVFPSHLRSECADWTLLFPDWLKLSQHLSCHWKLRQFTSSGVCSYGWRRSTYQIQLQGEVGGGGGGGKAIIELQICLCNVKSTTFYHDPAEETFVLELCDTVTSAKRKEASRPGTAGARVCSLRTRLSPVPNSGED